MKKFKIDKKRKTVRVLEVMTNEAGQIKMGWHHGPIIGPLDDISELDEETQAACLEARGETIEDDQGEDEQ